jgi:hypothetical protein
MEVGSGRGALFLKPQGFVGLPETLHLGAVRLPIADAVAAFADRINRGATGGRADATDESHGMERSAAVVLWPPVTLLPEEFYFDIIPKK